MTLPLRVVTVVHVNFEESQKIGTAYRDATDVAQAFLERVLQPVMFIRVVQFHLHTPPQTKIQSLLEGVERWLQPHDFDRVVTSGLGSDSGSTWEERASYRVLTSLDDALARESELLDAAKRGWEMILVVRGTLFDIREYFLANGFRTPVSSDADSGSVGDLVRDSGDAETLQRCLERLDIREGECACLFGHDADPVYLIGLSSEMA